jgi:hypothetical protein
VLRIEGRDDAGQNNSGDKKRDQEFYEGETVILSYCYHVLLPLDDRSDEFEPDYELPLARFQMKDKQEAF